MTADFKVCLDACVLANQTVCDLLLHLAETPRLFCPVFSGKILDEVRAVLLEKLKCPWPPHLAEKWQREVRAHFPESMVHGFEPLIPLMTNDEGDRHVLAAAVWGQAEVIVTFNLKHFREKDLEAWNVRAHHPQEYLTILYEMSPEVVVSKMYEMSAKLKRTPLETLRKLRKSIPQFSELVASDLGWELGE
jgi:predicted nucleic acid-binding protein